MDKSWDIRWKRPVLKGHVFFNSIYEVSRIGKSTKTESSFVFAKGWDAVKEECRMTARGYGASLGSDEMF